MTTSLGRRLVWTWVMLAAALIPPWREATARAPSSDPVAEQEARDATAMKRFLSLLDRSPRRGTALDRVYGYHVERGSLDDFLKGLRERLAKNPADGAGWMILGLLESQRGRDAPAVAALKKAQETRPNDPLPPYYLGQALLLVGQPDQAAAAFEQAIARKPTRGDLLEIFQALGRVYERTQRFDQALKVWNRLEAMFPSDLTVQEQIARTLAEEGRPDAALPRFEALSKKLTDPFRQIELAMRAADLKVKLGRKDDALRDFESLLARLRPDSWLHREARSKIEDVFLRNDDQPGLVAYYEAWIRKEPEDVDALLRIGRVLALMGRAGEAHGWYQKAVALAPGRREIRLALISQLASDGRFDQAAAQYEALDKAEPGNPDTLRDWGSLLLRDTSKTPPERKAAAAAVWKRMLDSKPKDPTAAAQVADLLRQAELVDDAIALYERAIELAGDNPQYHEYLGEYLHQLKRPEQALAAWSQIAAPPRNSARNLARLAEVLAGFGYVKEAAEPMTKAVELEGDSFDYRLKLAEILHRLERYDLADRELVAARKLATKDEEKAAALDARVTNDQSANRVPQRIEELRKAIAADPRPSVDLVLDLARYQETDGKLPEAVRTATRGVELAPRSIPAWTLLARVREAAGNLGDAAGALRKLGEIDRKNRAEYLTGVARLEQRLGRIEPALKAGRDLLEAAPGNPEHYEFFAQLCFQLGKSEEGLDALRRAVRVNPADTKIILTLADNLATSFRGEEALEMYWRAYEKSPTLDEKVGVVAKLAEISIPLGKFDRILARLKTQDRQGGAEAQPRDIAICSAQAFTTAGDLGSARAELERLLASNARDPQILQQLAKLTDEEGDFESAARYQGQLAELVISEENSAKLGELLMKAGEFDQAQVVWSRMASGKGESRRVYAAIDHLLSSRKTDAALRAAEDLIRKNPADWEALYRQGLALAELDKPDLAVLAFQRLLALTTRDDEKSAQARARVKDPSAAAASARPSAYAKVASIPLQDRLGFIYEIRSACMLEPRGYYSNSGASTVWAPIDFGSARMAALGWRLTLADKIARKSSAKVVEEYREKSQKRPTNLREAWDWFYLCSMRYDNKGAYEAAQSLAHAAPTDPIALWVFLHELGARAAAFGQRYYVIASNAAKDSEPPLPKAELDHAMAAYGSLRTRRPELAQAEILVNITTELKRAKRDQEGDAIYKESIASALQLPQIAGVFDLAAQRGDIDALLLLTDRYQRLTTGRPNPYFYTGSFYFYGPGLALSRGMSIRAEKKAYDDVLRILDGELELLARKIERQTASAARTARNQGSTNPGYIPSYQIWVGKQSRYMNIAFPRANEFLDSTSIQVIRTAFEIYKRDDLMSDLTAHLEARAERAKSPQSTLVARLAKTAIWWWNDDQDQAIEEFARVALAAPLESELRLDLAELLEQKGERADALAVLDAVQPYDTQTLQRREEIALRLAVSGGSIDRARAAAERLFGLRLDNDAQVKLASQMGQLGLGELAESVLARARRRAGNKASVLVGLMTQYQKQGKVDAALQIASQILRSTTAIRQTNPNYYNPESPDQARAAAISVLNRSGKLPELIARAVDQVKKTPTAIQPHQALADYYKAAGDKQKTAAELAAIVSLRPDDANLRLQVAQQLSQNNQQDQAVEHYKILIQKDPAILGRGAYQIMNTFQTAKKTDEFLDLLDKVEFRRLGQPYQVTNMLGNLQDPKHASRVMGLFKKTWEAFPEDRRMLLQYMYSDVFWESPEVYDLLREAIIPSKATFASGQQWYTLVEMVYSRGGTPRTMLDRLMEQAEARGRLDDLAAEIKGARQEIPGWTAGDVTLALVGLRQERYSEAQPAIDRYLSENKDDEYFSAVCAVIGDQLERHAETRERAVVVYEKAVAAENTDVRSYREDTLSPSARLVNLYKNDNRMEEARKLLLVTAEQEAPSGYVEEYATQLRMQKVANSARELRDLGYPADAAGLYAKALEILRGISPDTPYWYIGDRASIKTEYEQGLDSSIEELNPADLIDRLAQRLADQPQARDARKTRMAKNDDVVDVSLILNPRDIDRVAIRSLLEDSIAAAAKGDTKAWSDLTALLLSAQAKHPEDLSVAVTAALSALSDHDSSQIEPALKRLLEVADKLGLEPLSEGQRANSRQRLAAARLLPIWLAARAAGKHKDAARFQDLAGRLAEIALEAARRQSDNLVLLAMRREQGELALKQGDRVHALASWSRMLDAVIPEPKPSRPASLPIPKPDPAQKPAAPDRKPAAPDRKAAARTTPRILTIEQFDQATAIAKLAAENGLMDLSFRAVRDSLSGGPPVIPAPLRSSRIVVRNSNGDGVVDPVPGRVESALATVEEIWRKKRSPADRVYEALREVVLPSDRPTEIFLYAAPIAPQALDHPQSVAQRLAGWAARAGRLDDLEKRARERQGPAAVLPRDVLVALCALASNDPTRATRALGELHERHRNEASRATADLLCHVALPAYFDGAGGVKSKALDLITAAEKSLEGANQPEPLGTIMLRVARAQLDQGDVAGGRKRLEDYLAMNDRVRPNYNGDYGLFLRRRELEQVAGIYARVGRWSDALESLGRMADITTTNSDYGRMNTGQATARTLQLMDSLKPAERYRALLDWTMPREGRGSIRLLVASSLPMAPPSAFRPPSAGAISAETAREEGHLSTASALIAAAGECGKLDELAKQAQALAGLKDARKVENAEDLLIMVEAARGQVATIARVVEDRIARITKENDEAVAKLLPVEWYGRHPLRTTVAGPLVAGTPAPTTASAATLEFPAITFLVDQTLLRRADPTGRAIGRRLGEALRDRARLGQGMSSWPIEAELLRETARDQGDLRSLGGLASWNEATLPESQPTMGNPRSGWISHEGHLSRPFGAGGDLLYLNVPITGEYEFSVEMLTGLGISGSVTLGGLSVEPPAHSSAANVMTLGLGQILANPGDQALAGGSRRFTIKATPQQIRYFVDGRLVYTDQDPGVSAPWLGLVAGNGGRVVFRGPALTGHPIIPREVPLAVGNRLHGWDGLQGESILARPDFAAWGSAYPPRPKRDLRGNARPVTKKPLKLENYDWTAQDGVITGKRKTRHIETDRYYSNQDSIEDLGGQSELVYLRPLEDGDAVSYEFYYEPGEVMVSPACGQVAYLIEEGGEATHWITSPGAALWGVDATNRVAEQKASKPPLKPGEWNRAILQIDGGHVKITVNGQPLLDRPLDANQGRTFGLYHDKFATEARARKVVLTGRWPKEFPSDALADLTRPAAGSLGTDAARTLRHDLIGEEALSRSAERLLGEAQALPASARYERLAQWVLPSPDHPRIRLTGAFTPSFPAPDKPEPPGPARRQIGGELIAPALALVDAAKASGTLDNLANQLGKGPSSTSDPSALALLALIDLAKENDTAAQGELKSLATLVAKQDPRRPRADHWPGVIAAARAIERPATRPEALALLKIAADHARIRAGTYDESRAPDLVWNRQIAHLITRAEHANTLEKHEIASETSADDSASPWAIATRAAAFSRGGGFPIANWLQTTDEITHAPGHDYDFLYLKTPLTGDFQLSCELTAAPRREIRLMFAGICYGLGADATALERSRYGDFMSPRLITPPLENKGPWHALALAVKDKRMTLSIDGRLITTASAPETRDPWLALFSEAGWAGSVRKLVITGTPRVPESLALSSRPDLDGWDSDEYGESTLGDAAGWRKAGEEIKGRLRDNLPVGFKLESTLRYHRPLMDDDRVTYEFFYDPGAAMVHPALGRQVFMIEPEGLRIHWLTDESFDRAGLAPDNSHDEPDHRRGPVSPPLKPKAWNSLSLAIKGDAVTVTLNGQVIHEGPITPSNPRTFALFHYSEATEARARGVRLEGNWPRRPPGPLAPIVP